MIKKYQTAALLANQKAFASWIQYSRVFSCRGTSTRQGWLNGGQSRKGDSSSYTSNRCNGFLENISSRSRGRLLCHDIRGLLLRTETFNCQTREEGEETDLRYNFHFRRVDSSTLILVLAAIQKSNKETKYC